MDCAKVSENRQFAVCQNAICGVPNRPNSDGVSQLHRRYHGTDNNKDKDTICVVVFYVFVKHVQTNSPENQLDSTLWHWKLDLNQGCAKVCPAGCAVCQMAIRLCHLGAGCAFGTMTRYYNRPVYSLLKLTVWYGHEDSAKNIYMEYIYKQNAQYTCTHSSRHQQVCYEAYTYEKSAQTYMHPFEDGIHTYIVLHTF